jgi:ribose transport system permease protein
VDKTKVQSVIPLEMSKDRGRMLEKTKIQTLIPFIGLILIIIVFTALTSGQFLTLNNLKLVFEQSLLLIVACVGVTFVMSMGSLDFSQGSLLAISCLVAAIVAEVNIYLAVVCAILTGTAIGVLNGTLLAKYKMPSFIVTICSLFIFRGVTVYFTGSSSKQAPIEIYAWDNITLKIILLAIILIIGFYLFTYTKFGREVRAIGAGETAALFSGVNVKKVKILAFAFAGLLGGVVGILALVRTGVASPTTGLLFETDVLTAMVLGGMSITGGANSRLRAGIVGSLILAILGNGLVILGVEASVLQMLKGVIFLVAVVISLDRKGMVVIK